MTATQKSQRQAAPVGQWRSLWKGPVQLASSVQKGD